MKKLSLFASVSAALVCAAVPASLNWSPANVTRWIRLIPILSKSDSLGIERSRSRGIEACCSAETPTACLCLIGPSGMHGPM